ncbi:MAG TPA: phosphatase PAP2 family protein [Steroidobacteraceae bacterium]|nr:phosphatase PAP2 family protein [Steroidobacteraceae bacterium]
MKLAALLVALWLAGCATLPNGRGWGEDATIAPGWHRVGEAALEAVKSPRFWAPLAGATVFQIDGWDRKVSNWARRNTPVFGSETNAALWSDRLRSASTFAYVASVIATPSGGDPKDWVLDKVRGATVGVAAIAVTDEESLLLKNAAARERPNGQDTQSMPSSHTSRSAVLTELAERNVDALPIAPVARDLLDLGLDALTYGTAWARVESGFHFPSDTLVGMSIGNFNGAFFNDAFLGLEPRPQRLSFSIAALPGGAALHFEYGF